MGLPDGTAIIRQKSSYAPWLPVAFGPRRSVRSVEDSFQKGTSWDPPSLSVIGKGRKHRVVPIPRDTARLLEGYMGSLPDQ